MRFEQHRPGELVAVDPDQAFTHTSLPFCVRLGFELGRDGWNTATERARKVTSCPSSQNVPWIHRSAPQTDATDQRFQQKARELESGRGAAFRVVQLRSCSQELESDSGDAERYRESRLEYR